MTIKIEVLCMLALNTFVLCIIRVEIESFAVVHRVAMRFGLVQDSRRLSL